MSRMLLIDGDVLAYRAACAVEVATEWEPGYWTWHCDENEVKAAIDAEIKRYMEALEGEVYRICLTDNDNFRKRVLPTYKGKRANVKKPLVLKSIREWLLERGAVMRPGLEGDDVMGILATWSGLKEWERIIVSIDKDMKSIPGLYVRTLEEGVSEVSEAHADYWHLYQTLMGDATDGYSGCPKIGPKKAAAVLQQAFGIETVEDLKVSSLSSTVMAGAWKLVVATYADQKLGEPEALRQARVARILRASDYNFKTKEPILWSPPR